MKKLTNEKTKTRMARIILRNSTCEEWGNSTLILLKGEPAIDTTNNIMKIGDGEHKFIDLEPTINLTINDVYLKNNRIVIE